MKIKSIRLKKFRNYEFLELNTENDFLFFLGNNAQGKTNLLEALYYVSTSRSFRTIDELELIKFDNNFLKIDIDLIRNEKVHNLKCTVSENGKYLLFNEVPVKRVSDFIGKLNTVLFCPNDMKLLYSSPKERRKFIDMELGKISIEYMNNLLLYQKVLKERNIYLKRNKIDDDYLGVLTEQLIDIQIPIILIRNKFMNKLMANAQNIYQKLSEEKVDFKHIYMSTVPINDKLSMKDELLLKYQKCLIKDKELRITQIGTHREDFNLLLDDKEIMKYGSQGQRRSTILALKIGLLDVIFEQINEYPILLLDDVLSELDKKHRIKLFSVIPKGVQTFITATDIIKDEISGISNKCYYHVFNGNIKKED